MSWSEAGRSGGVWEFYEHTASVKEFVSLQFLKLRQSVGLRPRMGISPTQGRYLHRIKNTE
jgi:hypothetical protein